MFIVPNFEEEDEGAPKTALKTQATWSNRVPKAHFWHTPIDLNEEVEDMEEVGRTSIQLENSWYY
jgi:hypothetical protein